MCRVTVVCMLLLILMWAGRSVILVRGVQFEIEFDQLQDFKMQNATMLSADHQQMWLTPNPDVAKRRGDAPDNVVGRVVFNNPIPLVNQSSGQVVSFNTSFSFKIETACAYNKCGDGLAFSISRFHDMPPKATGGSLGILPNPPSPTDRHLFAVEFDTLQNEILHDPSASHIGIDFGDLTSVSTFDSSKNADHLYLYNNYTISAWVEYIAPRHLTLVFASNTTERPSKSFVNATDHDLSEIFVDPKEKLYAAISATSVATVQGAALLNWSFSSEEVNIPSPAPAPSLKSPPPPASSPAPSHSSTELALPLTLSLLGVGLLLAAACTLVYFKRRNHMFSQKIPAMIELIPSATGSVPRHSYRELKKATQGFSDKQKVGEGGFSTVYKGTLSTGDVVAVKRLKERLRMEVQFASEIQIISRIRHRNLLQLRGWGYEKGEALLVYQYMPNGSLDSYLFGKKRGHPELTDGGKRLNILVGVAAALEYLHEGLGECVLHRDVKAANVMLTESFEAMLGDFGLARLITHNEAVTMTAAGTPGYVAPEMVYTGRATDKADVYSFGMLALEVACGRRALNESLPPEEMALQEWVWLLQQSGKLTDALDPAWYPPVTKQQYIQADVANCTEYGSAEQIEEEALIARKSELDAMAKDWYSLQEIKWRCVLHVGLLCCMPSPEDRPTMRQVHQTLRERLVLPLPSTRPTYSGAASSKSFSPSAPDLGPSYEGGVYTPSAVSGR